jgi:hypothetical protein
MGKGRAVWQVGLCCYRSQHAWPHFLLHHVYGMNTSATSEKLQFTSACGWGLPSAFGVLCWPLLHLYYIEWKKLVLLTTGVQEGKLYYHVSMPHSLFYHWFCLALTWGIVRVLQAQAQ